MSTSRVIPTPTFPARPGHHRRYAAVSFALVLALAGCGGASADEGDEDQASADSVADAYGSVDIAKAERVVALSVSDADAALAAGVVPVAMTEAPVEPVMPWAKDAIDEIGEDDPELFQWSTEDTIPFEDIAAWEPDLVLATGTIIGKDTHEQLSEIAPTLATAEENTPDAWQDQAERVSTVLDAQSEGEKAIESAQTAIDDAAKSHPDLADRSFLVSLFHSPDEVGVLTDRDSATVQFFSELGLSLDPVADDMSAGKVPDSLSLEKLDVMQSDIIVGYFPDPKLQKKYEKVPTFTSLPAVEGGHFYQPTDEEWRGLRSVSALALPEIVDPIAQKLDKAVAGS